MAHAARKVDVMQQQERLFKVNLSWDNEAKVWTGLSDDVPGLCVEGDTIEEVKNIAMDIIPILLRENNADSVINNSPVLFQNVDLRYLTV